MENLKEALQYIADLGVKAEKTEILEICGKTYANNNLTRYDKAPKAWAIKASTLSSLVDYIKDCNREFGQDMLIHIVSPTQVRLISVLDKERERETLFEANAEVSKFEFDSWYSQERFMIELQANFLENDDLSAVKKMAGNIDRKNDQQFTDDGVTQVATMTVGVATKADVLVPNPVTLIPYRTFQEAKQPASKFVFRIGDKEEPCFKIVEAEGGIWENEAIANIKSYLTDSLKNDIKKLVTIIG